MRRDLSAAQKYADHVFGKGKMSVSFKPMTARQILMRDESDGVIKLVIMAESGEQFEFYVREDQLRDYRSRW